MKVYITVEKWNSQHNFMEHNEHKLPGMPKMDGIATALKYSGRITTTSKKDAVEIMRICEEMGISQNGGFHYNQNGCGGKWYFHFSSRGGEKTYNLGYV